MKITTSLLFFCGFDLIFIDQNDRNAIQQAESPFIPSISSHLSEISFPNHFLSLPSDSFDLSCLTPLILPTHLLCSGVSKLIFPPLSSSSASLSFPCGEGGEGFGGFGFDDEERLNEVRSRFIWNNTTLTTSPNNTHHNPLLYWTEDLLFQWSHRVDPLEGDYEGVISEMRNSEFYLFSVIKDLRTQNELLEFEIQALQLKSRSLEDRLREKGKYEEENKFERQVEELQERVRKLEVEKTSWVQSTKLRVRERRTEEGGDLERKAELGCLMKRSKSLEKSLSQQTKVGSTFTYFFFFIFFSFFFSPSHH